MIAPLALHAEGASAPAFHEATFRSRLYEIDRVYRSMEGPEATEVVRLGVGGPREMLWITGYRTRIAGADGQDRSEEFMCHSNLDIADVGRHQQAFASGWPGKPRLFTLSQGQMAVAFPEGFGVPVYAGEPLLLGTQVLNLNPQPETLQVVHETTIAFARDSEARVPMKPLFQRAAQGMVLVHGSDPYYGVAEPDPEQHGPGCMVGAPAGQRTIRDPQGRRFAAHWVVKPGRQVNRTLVTSWLEIPFDTTVHHIAVHLHPFAESLELRDLTTGETVFRALAHSSEGRIGLDRVDSYSSTAGIPVFADHEYELVSVYDNTTDEDQDAMAAMFLYMLDKGFARPAWAGSPAGKGGPPSDG